MNAKFLAVSFLSATRLDDVSLSGDAIHSFQLVGLPKIPIVFNIGQKNGTISGRLSERPTSGQIMALYLAVSLKNQFWPEILAFLWPSSVKAGWQGLEV